MARLPDIDELGQRPIPQSRRSVARVRNAGTVGEGLEGIGRSLYGTGETVLGRKDEQREREARLEAAQARSAFVSEKIALDSEFENDHDFDTAEQRYGEKLTAIRTKASEKIKSPFGRSMFEEDVRPDAERGIAGIKAHIFNGRKDLARANVTTTLASNLDSLLAATNEEDRIALLDSTRSMLGNAQASGFMSAQEAAEQRLTLTEKYAKGRLSLMPDTEQVTTLGTSLLAESADGKTGTFVDYIPRDDRVTLMRSAEARLRAEESRLRAERKLEMQEQVDAAEEVARLITDGIPVPGETIDNAIAVAKTANKDALAYRLGVGKVRNNLTVEFTPATPDELQDDIDGLSAKIAAAGDNAKPEDVIARDHLVTMRDQKDKLLKTDPLEFAARAWGTRVPDLDWSNPQSIRQRGQLAASIAQRAGLPAPMPLRQAEVEDFKETMAKGAGGKVQVMDQLRQFGPGMASAAARQLASADDPFTVAVALATSPFSGREVARDVLTGADALAANPNVFNDGNRNMRKERVDKLYGEFVTPALRLLPAELSNAVKEASVNIYAERMRRLNKGEYDEPQWWVSVNRALGQFRDGTGTVRGGLAQHKGGLVMLPQGVSQQEFEGALANPEALLKSGNGQAVWDNGAAVTTSQVGKLNLVADGNGTYRLTDGDGFISVKGGGAFRLDFMKLLRAPVAKPARTGKAMTPQEAMRGTFK